MTKACLGDALLAWCGLQQKVQKVRKLCHAHRPVKCPVAHLLMLTVDRSHPIV